MMEKHLGFADAKTAAISLAEKYGESFHVIVSRGAYYVENGAPLVRSWEFMRGYAKPTKGKRARWYGSE
jgi:hypothetical protein